MLQQAISPGTTDPQTYRRVLAGFVLIGESLSAWSKRNGYQHQNVRSAVTGSWNGPRAHIVKNEVFSYLLSKGVSI